MLLKLIDERGLKDSEVYKKANVTKQTFSKIRNNKGYQPTKETAIAFAIALELSLDETKDLLLKAGYALSKSSRFDLIIQYFIDSQNFDIFEINEVLFAYEERLLDAVGKSIQKMINVQAFASDHDQAEKVMFVISTDGLENASTEYGFEQIKTMIERQKEKDGWEFIFLGANIDAIKTAKSFGIKEDRAANYHADSAGTLLNYEAINETLSMVRASKAISPSWKEKIDKDYVSRK